MFGHCFIPSFNLKKEEERAFMKHIFSIALMLSLFVGCAESTPDAAAPQADETSSTEQSQGSSAEGAPTAANTETVVMKVPGMT